MFASVDEWSKTPRNNMREYEKEVKPRDVQEFEHLIQNSLPNWSAIWHMVAEKNTEKPEKRVTTTEDRSFVLQKKIRKKVRELVVAQETLVDLYKEAAEVARAKGEEFKDKTAILMEQIEKDKHLLKKLSVTH